ncbi:MAG: phosphoribosylamine--glycine ligase [Thermomicrobiales bacterium]
MGDRVIVVGNGAREHALVWKLAQSPQVETIVSVPGNPGTAAFGDTVALDVLDSAGITALSVEQRADLVVVGPEAPLAAGLADELRSAGIAVCGPSRSAARIESSKSWAKALMVGAGVPTARAETVAEIAAIENTLAQFALPVVIKADGLAAGKGVVVAQTREEAASVCRDMLAGTMLGKPAGSIVIEQFLTGQEVSLLAITDGHTIVPLLPACDYKRAQDNDLGPNTGGMGGYAPPPFVDVSMMETIRKTILEPVVNAMDRAGSPMQGVLYAGLMITDEGPQVIEFNARFGDPETQIILPLLASDLYPLLRATDSRELASVSSPLWADAVAVGVVLASGGYPGAYQTGLPIHDDGPIDSTEVFFAGVTSGPEGDVRTSGGRVLTAVGIGASFAEATSLAYERAQRISFPGMAYRHDIARRELPAVRPRERTIR